MSKIETVREALEGANSIITSHPSGLAMFLEVVDHNEKALTALDGLTDTEELIEMLRGMRRYNGLKPYDMGFTDGNNAAIETIIEKLTTGKGE